MTFPTNPSVGDAYTVAGITWYFDGDGLGWYRAYVGANGELIKSYASYSTESLLSRLIALENQMAELQSKTLLELE